MGVFSLRPTAHRLAAPLGYQPKKSGPPPEKPGAGKCSCKGVNRPMRHSPWVRHVARTSVPAGFDHDAPHQAPKPDSSVEGVTRRSGRPVVPENATTAARAEPPERDVIVANTTRPAGLASGSAMPCSAPKRTVAGISNRDLSMSPCNNLRVVSTRSPDLSAAETPPTVVFQSNMSRTFPAHDSLVTVPRMGDCQVVLGPETR